MGLKIYLNQTTGGFIVDEKVFRNICEAWPAKHPIIVHAEADVIEEVISIAHAAGKHVHVAHVSSQNELQTILNAKMKGYMVSCGVTPHHLFMTEDDTRKLGPVAMMKPTLKSPNDVAFLWKHLADIDLIESDHAPHTLEEKQSEKPPFGVPGLETTLPLLLTAAHEGKLTIEDIKRLCHDGPAQIFSPGHPELTKGSSVEIDENEEWTVENGKLFTKCNWSPFHGWKMKGRVKRVFIRETTVFEQAEVLVKPGFGKIL